MADAVTDNQEENRFEMAGTGALIVYQRLPGRIDLVHTKVPEALSGQGVGSRLVKGALDLIRAEGLRVVPSCPFVAAFIERHPRYRSLVG